MHKTDYPNLGESLYTQTLSNGLRVMVAPKPGFSRKVAYFVTDYGAVHTRFSLEGTDYTVPDGVAHYLEHKLFDLPGRDVSAEFAAMGAVVNAFTSYDVTAYYFSGTEHFDDCLRLLLEFVSTPYFTEESVQKEQGIIGQEIDMNLDEPGTQVFENLMKSMYASHPVRQPILGTRESIAQITPQILQLCHRAFYTPENMLLCVVGDVDPETVCTAALEVLGPDRRPVGRKAAFLPEPDTCLLPECRGRMELPMPTFCLGFKGRHPGTGEAAIRQEMVGYLASELLFGESSQLYLQMYEQGLIDSSFGGGYETLDGCAMLTCGGDSEDAQAIRSLVLDRAAQLIREGIDEAALLRLKRSAMGQRLRNLDSFDSTCFRLCAYAMSDFDYFRFPEIYDSINSREILDFLAENIRPERCTLSVLDPMKEDHYEP